MPKIGSGKELKATPRHLPDISEFHVIDIIKGPLKVIPKPRIQKLT